MTENITEFTDILGVPITEGIPVGYANGNAMLIGIVEKLTPKMIKIRKVRSSKKTYRSNPTLLRYPHDVIVLDQKQVTIYMLKL